MIATTLSSFFNFYTVVISINSLCKKVVSIITIFAKRLIQWLNFLPNWVWVLTISEKEKDHYKAVKFWSFIILDDEASKEVPIENTNTAWTSVDFRCTKKNNILKIYTSLNWKRWIYQVKRIKWTSKRIANSNDSENSKAFGNWWTKNRVVKKGGKENISAGTSRTV